MAEKQPRFFLGANSKQGFISVYEQFTDPAAGDFLWVIKGGPGCGKSTFMKRIGAAAEAAGERVVYYHCSGDPDSLDAVYLPQHKVAYVDGTKPHVVEAAYPGAASLYLDLGSFFDAGALACHLPAVMELNRRNEACYREAYALLRAGAALLPQNMAGCAVSASSDKLDKRISGFAARELPDLKKCSRRKVRFLSAWSCRGHLTFSETLDLYADRIFLLDNRLGRGNVFLSRLETLAAEKGYDRLVCADPLEAEKTEVLIIPERRLALIASADPEHYSGTVTRRMHLDALGETLDKRLLRSRKKQSNTLLDGAVAALKKAKSIHDELEMLYRPYVDFDGVDTLTEDHIGWLFG